MDFSRVYQASHRSDSFENDSILNIGSSFGKKAFNEENQIKTIKYIDLEKYHLSKKPSKEEIKEVYNKNEFIKMKNVIFYGLHFILQILMKIVGISITLFRLST